MSDKLKVAFDDPEHGWVGLTISRGDESATIVASYTPSDSFLDLTNALANLFQYSGAVKVVWHSGPREYELHFASEGGVVRFGAYEYPDRLRDAGRGELLLEASGTYQEICLPFWRALRNLQGRFSEAELSARWHRAFPWKEVDGLSALLRDGHRRSRTRS